MARKKLIAGNWKMNNSNKEALELVNSLKGLVKDVKDRDIMIAPTFTCLSDVNNAIKGTNIKLGGSEFIF
ncbi:triose-phosphate isomerase [Brachyspira hyodysenteriae]|uniref:triose-phosphate isomerase n=1 Tax=Brachyspira hyodysenteriae TaxID=159 RepID=UPI0022CD217C|nr:triose-phosphate isomerase [Brachyspira hyodysenteriae]MCZ9839818.1 triose-phosphate isomerase [Brachyspira hyodysenteriae]MCZ9846869.1 triose-phosphate isomerase [Brachyspira hyodysenteriae]MCZ9873160.1 triose-phosphate isomerase [Brachyspira hyodysenteriae]MCZ9888886.1 triose-phosphate isomerase [Brachyspira hyodysenteriae]MCZ9891712.1 triose-phosphate isomerase [Brachyspira hyodysenteriae]